MNFKTNLSLILAAVFSITMLSSLTAQEVPDNLTLIGTCEYDSNGNLIHEKTQEGEYWFEYNSNGKVIHSRIQDEWEERETWNEYDSQGRLVYQKYTGGESRYEYNLKAHTITEYSSTDSSWKYDCDSNWNKLHGTNGTISYWAEYDSNGNQTLYRTMDGFKIVYEYDSQNRLVKKSEDNNTYITYYEYDKDGKLFHEHSNYDSDVWYSYTYWENGKVKERKQYSAQ